jgi:enamine deaminase RidA (YjgF/YER057c/UK114 family)
MWSSRQISSIKRIGVDDPRMSRIVVNNGVVYISGQTDATGKTIEEQTKNVLAKVDALLEEAGTDKSKLLTSSIWLKDMETDYDGFNDVWNNWIDPDQKPVRATVENSMARSILLVEVQATAAVGR